MTTRPMHPLGRHLEPNHDPMSLQYPAERASALKTVLHQHNGPVLDQGQLGSCTGNAAAQALNTDPLMPHGRRLLTEQDAIGIYSWATAHDPYPGQYPPQDTGSSGLAVAKAAKHLGLITGYAHAFGLAHVLSTLVLRPLIVGTRWHQDMFTPDPDGTVHPTGAVVGGHEYLLLGLDVAQEFVYALNSWGTNWGVDGMFRIEWNDLSGLLSDSGDATVLLP